MFNLMKVITNNGHLYIIQSKNEFSIVSISTTGLGDFKPTPKNMAQTLIIILYLCIGITILSAIYASLAYYWQRFHFITLKSYMFDLGKKIFAKRKNKICPANGNHQY